MTYNVSVLASLTIFVHTARPLLQGDGFHRVNGDVGGLDPSPGDHGRESPNDFQPSPSLHSPSAADAPSPGLSLHTAGEGHSLTSPEASGQQGGTEAARQEAGREEVTEHSTPPSRPTSLPEVSQSLVNEKPYILLLLYWKLSTPEFMVSCCFVVVVIYLKGLNMLL